jgi:hypothetical protein
LTLLSIFWFMGPLRLAFTLGRRSETLEALKELAFLSKTELFSPFYFYFYFSFSFYLYLYFSFYFYFSFSLSSS